MSSRLRLILALLLPFVAATLQWQLWDPWIQPYVWFLFYPTAFFSAWLGGLVGGMGATLLSSLLAWYLFIPPALSFGLPSTSTAFSIAGFVLMGSLFAWVHERLQRALRSSQGRFEATFEQAAVGIALLSPEGRWLRVNRALCAIVGYSQQELLAKTFQDITFPEDLADDLAQVERMLTRQINSYTLEKRYRHKDGHTVWINLSVALAWAADGTPDYFISVVEDISARKTAEQRFIQLFEKAPVALVTCNRAGQIQLMNQAYVDLFGYSIQDTPLLDDWRRKVLVDPAQRAAAETDWTNRWDSGDQRGVHTSENLALCRDGTSKTVLLSRTRLGEEMMVVAIDITQRNAEQEQMRQHIDMLTRFHRAAVGRELDMVALKREVNTLSLEMGREPPYRLDFADTAPARG